MGEGGVVVFGLGAGGGGGGRKEDVVVLHEGVCPVKGTLAPNSGMPDALGQLPRVYATRPPP